MDDLFTELLVPKKQTTVQKLTKVLLIVFTVLAFAFALIIPYFIFAGLAMVLADWYFLPKLNVEYEYSYVSGTLDIDKIFSKSSRKRAASFELSKMEVMAQSESHRLDDYKNVTTVLDYTSGDPKDHDRFYTFVFPMEKGRTKVMIMPNENILKDMKRRMPSKVFFD